MVISEDIYLYGLMFGIIIYILLFSKIIMNIGTKALKLINKIIFSPILKFSSFLSAFILKNIKKILFHFPKPTKKLHFKKDF